ncbi:unnamed protein product, partial [Meganyctiphanes norvegica]
MGDQIDQDEIRKKRLARLAARPAASNQSTSEGSSDAPVSPPPQSPQPQLGTSPPSSSIIPSPSKRHPPPSPLDVTPCKKGASMTPVEPMDVDDKDDQAHLQIKNAVTQRHRVS